MGWIALSIGLLALLIYALLDTAKREDQAASGRWEKSAGLFGDATKAVDPFAERTLTGWGP
jgi:hypothetical protein